MNYRSKYISLLTLSYFLQCFAVGQSKQNTRETSTFRSDTSKINGLIKAAGAAMYKGELPEAMALASTALEQSKKITFKYGICKSLNVQGRILYRQASYDSSITHSKESLLLAQDLKDSALQTSALLNLGNANYSKGNETTAMEYYLKGLAIEEKLEKQSNIYSYLNNISGIIINQKNYYKGLEYLLKAKAIAERTHDNSKMGTIFNNIGSLYIKIEKYDSAKVAFEKSFEFAKAAKDLYVMDLYPANMAELYIKLKQYDKAYTYAYKNYLKIKKQGFKDQLPYYSIMLGTILIEQGKYDDAEGYLAEGLSLSKEIDYKQVTRDIHLRMATLYDRKGNYQKAYEHYQLYSITKDTLLNQENSKLITEMNTKYTTEKKEKEIELLKKNEDIQKLELAKKKNELDKQRSVSIGAFTGFLLLMIVAVLLFSRYRLKKKANDQLQSAFNLIEEKNKVIEKSSALITDSITYAKRIQDAILPAREDLEKVLSGDFFVFYQPAHIVSGDFYWCSSHNNKTILIVADCTGHGVPGAFMSMIGNTLLNEIVNERKITDTKEIAHLLDEKIISSLHQHTDSDQYDGMDISICCIDKNKNKITFTGAHHAMYAVNGHVQKVRGDAYAIGGAQQRHTKTFTSHTIPYEKGLQLYFLTDGYCDQSGGASNKRFSSKQFENLLTEVQELQMEAQKEKLKHAFENWKGETKQRDDILVVGIKC